MNIDISGITWGAPDNWFVVAIITLLFLLLLYRLTRTYRVHKVLAPTKQARAFLRHCSMSR